jgi:hypothetical protein
MINHVWQNSINKLWLAYGSSQQCPGYAAGKTFINGTTNHICMRPLALLVALIFVFSIAGYQSEAQSRIVGPSDSVRVVISDSDLNGNPKGVDDYEDPEFVVFRTSRDEVGEAHPDIVETGTSTGHFEFRIQLETDERACRLDLLEDPRFAAEGGSDPSVGVCPGDVLLVQYEDNKGADGRSTLVDHVFEVKSWNPEFTTDRDMYSPGDRITVNIFDPDANRDPDVADSLRDVRVYSESDPAGRQFSAIETGRDTGQFRVSFSTSIQTQGNAILVKDHEEVTVQYIDDFPADFTALQEEKRFSFVMAIGGSTEEGGVTPSEPTVRNAKSGITGELLAGQQAILSTEISSSFQKEELSFVAILEVRDSSGVTVSIGWQSGSLPAQGQTEVGMSWLPKDPGNFQVRTFLISDLLSPQVLSEVASTMVTVS